MPGKAGNVKIIYSAETAQYSAAVKKMIAETRQFEQGTKSARKEMAESRAAVALLGDEIGVRLPRHLRNYVTELPGVASAMSAAFSTIAVVGLIDIVVKAGEKVYEFAQKNEEVAERNKKIWGGVSGSLQESVDDLRVVNDKLDESIAKLSGKPVNGMKLAIDEAIVSADKLGKQLGEDVDKIAAALKDTQPGWLDRLQGRAGAGDITSHSTKLSGALNEIDLEGHDKLQGLRAGGATDAQLSGATGEINAKRKKAIDDEIAWVQSQITAATASYANAGLTGTTDKTQRLALLRSYGGDLARVADVLQLSEDATIKQAKEVATKAAAAAVIDPRFDPRVSSVSRLGLGYPGANLAQIEQYIHNLNAAPGATPVLPESMPAFPASQLPTAANYSPYTMLSPQIIQRRETTWTKFLNEMDDLQYQFTNLSQILGQQVIQGLEMFNRTLIDVLSTPKSWMRGQHPWRNLGAGLATSAADASLRFGEGQIMKLLGFSRKADGSQNAPFWIKSADKRGAGGVSSMGSGLLGAMNDSNFLGGLFGGKLFGSGSFFGNLASHLPGFAEGGMIPNAALVGERGPEILLGAGGSRIIPNDQIGLGGGGVTNYINAAGATDPAATVAAVHRAMAAYIPHMRNMSKQSIVDHNRRVAPSKRI